ncbi:MAG: hypothetical protein GY696_17025, partial [Gammaproteobacteria bacterium]|nr:hypothetical protein [Gammaproteobacteria bacterium]
VGRPLSNLQVCLPLKVRCHGAVEVTLLCAVDEGDSPEAEFLLGKGGMHDFGFKLLSPTGEDLLASQVSTPCSALESQQVAVVTQASCIRAKAKEEKNILDDRANCLPQLEVGDQVLVPSRELRRCRLSQKYRSPGIIIRKTNVNAMVQLQHGMNIVTKKFRQRKLAKVDPVPSGWHPCPSVVSVGTTEPFSGEGRGSHWTVHPGSQMKRVARVRRVPVWPVSKVPVVVHSSAASDCRD